MIIVFGSEHNCEHSIGFGKQLIDTFKPKTVFIEDNPLEEPLKQGERDENGFVYPGINKVIDRLQGEEMVHFIKESIVNNKEAYDLDTKQNLIYQNDF
jgi:hypothetical protein